MAAIAPFIGVPYRLHGREPETGWDCWGCTRHVRKVVWGVESPSWSDAYDAAVAVSAEAVEQVISERLGGWHETELLPGVALLFRVFGRAAHVGTYLGRGEFLHTLAGCNTSVEPLDSGRWKGRLVAAYECR